ncbi:hypothetical protein [Candidatus Odyssella thessalonicensis]|uniref:hypothetical protein n=1 Tax=Candidatus Odyssella thessalonicensis TaxID=84647 RepID=UPI000225B475|nr:hypothetical protein [Candidatus Odyssella thessalonicensis]
MLKQYFFKDKWLFSSVQIRHSLSLLSRFLMVPYLLIGSVSCHDGQSSNNDDNSKPISLKLNLDRFSVGTIDDKAMSSFNSSDNNAAISGFEKLIYGNRPLAATGIYPTRRSWINSCGLEDDVPEAPDTLPSSTHRLLPDHPVYQPQSRGVGYTITTSITAGISLSRKVSVMSGKLSDNGKLSSSEIIIAADAALIAKGPLHSLQNSGSLKLSTSISTLQVLTNFDNTNGIFNCEINDAGQSDFLTVMDTAVLGGTLNILPHPGDYSAPVLYTILTAINPIVGHFTAVTCPVASLSFTINYLSNSVVLTAVDQGS